MTRAVPDRPREPLAIFAPQAGHTGEIRPAGADGDVPDHLEREHREVVHLGLSHRQITGDDPTTGAVKDRNVEFGHARVLVNRC